MNTPEDLLIDIGIDRLGFCGCGNPVRALEVVCLVLRILKIFHEGENINNCWKALDELPRQHPVAFMNILLYMLDDKGFTEHGGGVYGSWLQPSGEDLLNELTEAIEGLKPNPQGDNP
jgi:hypothetical protein